MSSISEPIGVVEPFILRAKTILQSFCRKKLGSKDENPSTAVSRLNKRIKEVPKLAELKVQRCSKREDFGEIKTVEFHNISDAVEDGFCAVP